MTRSIATTLCGVLCAVLLPTVAAAQSSRVYGTFTDETSGALPALTVTAIKKDGDRETLLTVKTDRSGAFDLADLPAGAWTLRAELPGFETRSRQVVLAPGESVEWSAALPIGEVQETIFVSSVEGPAPPTRRPAPPTAMATTGTAAPGPRIGGQLKPPSKLVDVRPVYPSHLSSSGVGGQVRLTAIIGRDGLVSEVIPDPSANVDLAASATTALRAWEFTPTLLNGTPVETRMRATFNFVSR